MAAATGGPTWVTYRRDLDAPLAGTARRGYAYQHFVCGLPHDPAGRRIVEWSFAGYEWDGIEVPTCTLLEAKYNYDEGFLEDDWGGGSPRPLRWVLAAGIFAEMVDQATQQLARIVPFQPEVSLKWVFSHQRASIYFLALLNQANISAIETEWRPYSQG